MIPVDINLKSRLMIEFKSQSLLMGTVESTRAVQRCVNSYTPREKKKRESK